MENERVRAAKDFLRSHLEDLIQHTSDEYHYGIWRQPDPQAEADFAREIIQDCKNRSVERIADCFDRFLHALGESQTLQERVSRAKELSWEVIDGAFRWTPGDHSDYRIFAEWIGSRDPIMTGELNLPRNPEGVPWDCVAHAINYDFWSRFDRLLKQLADDRLSAVPSSTPVSTETLASGSSAGEASQLARSGPCEDPDLLSKDKKRRGTARARLVARIKWELDTLRPDYFSDRDFDRLANRFRAFVTFRICANRRQLRESLALLKQHKQYLWLAIRIAAAGLGKKEATIQDNWRRYNRFLKAAGSQHTDRTP